ncbi:pollen-specific leucine-rich repeat extensin-like protein 3 [Iris pallida]|uniref:Pollen-specific leucine-rich repeat extensin-like protein 3 n=1 Tax=Iris pallida TaxID=29817 RepID=A0AAX6H8G6_IRIPA|nr:pollen-specific leucine-rich repeat extensin-like protein 3 [Iris pallida]
MPIVEKIQTWLLEECLDGTPSEEGEGSTIGAAVGVVFLFLFLFGADCGGEEQEWLRKLRGGGDGYGEDGRWQRRMVVAVRGVMMLGWGHPAQSSGRVVVLGDAKVVERVKGLAGAHIEAVLWCQGGWSMTG